MQTSTTPQITASELARAVAMGLDPDTAARLLVHAGLCLEADEAEAKEALARATKEQRQ